MEINNKHEVHELILYILKAKQESIRKTGAVCLSLQQSMYNLKIHKY